MIVTAVPGEIGICRNRIYQWGEKQDRSKTQETGITSEQSKVSVLRWECMYTTSPHTNKPINVKFVAVPNCTRCVGVICQWLKRM